MKILLIEDEKKLSEALCSLLEKKKYSVDVLYDGKDAVSYCNSGMYDVVILDIMLPVIDGLSILRIVRKSGNCIPIILLTALENINEKVNGLEAGADDYITKPFSTDELLARIKAVSRRKGQITDNILSYQDIKLNIDTTELCCNNKTIKLGLKEFQLMEFLIQNAEQVLSKERILDKIWGLESGAEYNNVEVYISFIRKKLLYLLSKVEIKTSRGLGYYLYGNI